MKQKDIKIGATLLTKVNGTMCKVVVIAERSDTYSGRTKYVVERIYADGARTPLQKWRSPSALHPLKETVLP
jgi:hypothetical protein